MAKQTGNSKGGGTSSTTTTKGNTRQRNSNSKGSGSDYEGQGYGSGSSTKGGGGSVGSQKGSGSDYSSDNYGSGSSTKGGGNYSGDNYDYGYSTEGGSSDEDDYGNDTSYGTGNSKGGGTYSGSNTNDGYSSKEGSSYEDNYDSGGSFGSTDSKYGGDNTNDPYGNESPSKGRSSYDDDYGDSTHYSGGSKNSGNYSNDDSEGGSTTGNSKYGGYNDNEPINDPPPYDDYNHEVIAKRPETDTSRNPEKGGGNYEQEADMVFTEEEVFGNTDERSSSSDENTDSPRPETGGDVFDRFVERFGEIRFRNAQEINRFFADHSSQSDFLTWFKDNVGGRGAWRHRRFGNVTSQNQAKFNAVWDKIPLIYRGGDEDYAINIFQFFGLVSIMINEVGQTFTPIRERGGLSYMFGTIIPASRHRPERRKRSYNNFGSGPSNRNNKTAFELFNDENFLSAHRNEPLYDRVANTTNRAWHGDVYPSGFSSSPAQAGIISQADFYKFSGRGLVQTTWSRAYMRLIDATMRYGGQNQIIGEYRNQWRGKHQDGLNIRQIASQTKNRDWDRLFMETNNEFACLSVFCFQQSKNDFLQIPSNASVLRRTNNGESGSGSIYYVGYRVGGSRSYGELVRERVIQMMTKILNDNDQA